VGLVKAPPEEEQWFCKRCQMTPVAAATKTGAKRKTGGGRGRGRRTAKRR